MQRKLDITQPFVIASVLLAHHGARLLIRQNHQRIFLQSEEYEPQLCDSLKELWPIFSSRVHAPQLNQKAVRIVGIRLGYKNKNYHYISLRCWWHTVSGTYEISSPRFYLKRHLTALEHQSVTRVITALEEWVRAFYRREPELSILANLSYQVEQGFLKDYTHL